MDVQQFPFEKLHFEKLTDKIARRYVSGEKATLAQFQLKKGAFIGEHSHPNEQISYLLKGAIKLKIQNQDYIIHPGEVILIPSNVPHELEALEDSLLLDVFSPYRNDWIDGNTHL